MKNVKVSKILRILADDVAVVAATYFKANV